MFSEDQKETARFANMEGRLSLSVGSKRTGKTTAACGAFFAYTQALDRPYKHCIGGRKLRVIERELMPKFRRAAEVIRVPYKYNRADNIAYIGQQEYHCVAGNDGISEDRIWGLTLHSGLCDEVTRVPESFWKAMTAQLTYADSKLWGMTNPEGPLHWTKRNWLDQDKFHQHVQYHMDGAPFLPEEVKQAYRDMYSGAFFLRYYEGEWAANEGIIYEHWTETVPDPEARVLRTEIGVDYGGSSPSAFVVMQKLRQGNLLTYHIPEVVYVEEPERDSDLAKRLIELASKWNVAAANLPHDAMSLKLELAATPGRRFAPKNAKNTVLPGIRLTQNALESGKLTIAPGEATKSLKDELTMYHWEEDKDDTPFKEYDHACDAMRYVAMSLIAHPTVENVTLPRGF